jgi:hypothetical protein
VELVDDVVLVSEVVVLVSDVVVLVSDVVVLVSDVVVLVSDVVVVVAAKIIFVFCDKGTKVRNSSRSGTYGATSSKRHINVPYRFIPTQDDFQMQREEISPSSTMLFLIIPLKNAVRLLFRIQWKNLFNIIRFNTSIQYELYNYIKVHRTIVLFRNETKLYMNSAYTRFFNYSLLYAYIYLCMRVFLKKNFLSAEKQKRYQILSD